MSEFEGGQPDFEKKYVEPIHTDREFASRLGLKFQKPDEYDDPLERVYSQDPQPTSNPELFSTLYITFTNEVGDFASKSLDVGVAVGRNDGSFWHSSAIKNELWSKDDQRRYKYLPSEWLRSGGYDQIVEYLLQRDTPDDPTIIEATIQKLVEEYPEAELKHIEEQRQFNRNRKQSKRKRKIKDWLAEKHKQLAESERGEEYFQELTQKVQEYFPQYTSVDNQYEDEQIVNFYGEQDDDQQVSVLSFNYDGKRVNIDIGRAKPDEDGSVHLEPFYKQVGTWRLPQPRRHPKLEWEEMHWKDSEMDMALEKIQMIEDGLILTPDVLNTAVGWSTERNEPITFADYISYHYKDVASILDIPPSDNYDEFYMHIYPRSIKDPEQVKNAAIFNLSQSNDPIVIDEVEYDANEVIDQISRGTELGQKIINKLLNKVSAWEYILEHDRSRLKLPGDTISE